MTRFERMLNPRPRWVPRDAVYLKGDLLGCTWIATRDWPEHGITAACYFEPSLFARFDGWLFSHRATRPVTRLWWRKSSR